MIAVYQRGGVCWVAEFRDGHGELHDAAVWFRFHAGALRYCHNRRLAALKSDMPLIPEMLEKIEHLHRASEAREERLLPVPRTVAAAARRWAIGLMSHLRGREWGLAMLGMEFQWTSWRWHSSQSHVSLHGHRQRRQ